MRPDLHNTFDGAVGRAARSPDGALGMDEVDLEALGAADPDGAGVGLDRGDVARTAVGAGTGDAETLALSDGETVDAFVLGEDLTRIVVDDSTRPDAASRGTSSPKPLVA